MRPYPSLLLVCPGIILLVVAGCRPSGSASSGADSPPPARVGPSLDRLYGQLSDPKSAPSEKEAYWRRARGTLVSGKGAIRQVTDVVRLECPLSTGATVSVTAYPTRQAASGLSELKAGETVSVLGVLSARDLGGSPPAGCAASFELREARITIPMR